ncbi:unnamed protein product [Albugo candida]|uniref:PPIase cyclophilin-type domain-containing protein n=1 Tax=Albugo candida TaxID=65357 RepID=A0A024FWY3_9STRA|nr:unnamed protein product [Albugo candida]|eukprot:CCI11174.1 unnamed protein product [Albugo candida]
MIISVESCLVLTVTHNRKKVENFRALCTEEVDSKRQKKALHFKAITFHRIVPIFMYAT